jgi:hypothetical protein
MRHTDVHAVLPMLCGASLAQDAPAGSPSRAQVTCCMAATPPSRMPKPHVISSQSNQTRPVLAVKAGRLMLSDVCERNKNGER